MVCELEYMNMPPPSFVEFTTALVMMFCEGMSLPPICVLLFGGTFWSYIFPFFRLTTVKYVTEEDEISMGAVSTIVTPKHEERPVMKEYYS